MADDRYDSSLYGPQIEEAVRKAHKTGSSDPTTSTVGMLGQRYFNTTSGATFECIDIDTVDDVTTFTWRPVIANNLTETVAGKALDAVQGKALADIISTKPDIETGTWTPILEGQITAGTNTYDIQSGYYYKIGKLVVAHYQLRLSVKDGAMAGSIQISGLPFVSATHANIAYTGNMSYYSSLTGLTTDGLIENLAGNNTKIALYRNDPATAGNIGVANITSTSRFAGQIIYEAA